MDGIIQIKKSIVKEFEFNYEACSITEDKIIALLGYDSDCVPEPVSETIHSIIKEIPNRVRLKSGYKIFNPRKVKIEDYHFIIDNRNFNCKR
ncbi:MAG: hypothetical protein IPJ23_02010 [Ignavibacteriales bacterium]|nr:hypothetical protein [Ignavibacteriales bacterium]